MAGGLREKRAKWHVFELYTTNKCGTRNFVISENRIPQGQLYEEMSEEGITVKNGMLQVPSGPGLGIMLRSEVLNEFIENGRWE